MKKLSFKLSIDIEIAARLIRTKGIHENINHDKREMHTTFPLPYREVLYLEISHNDSVAFYMVYQNIVNGPLIA